LLIIHSSTGETPFFLLYGRDAKLPSALNFHSPHPKTPVIYSDYGTILFKELKFICEVARESIQQARPSQKKQYDKSTRPVTIQVGNTVLINKQPKFKLDRSYHGPYLAYEVTDTTVKVKPVTERGSEARCVSLQKVSRCKESIPTDQVWLGHSNTKVRKRRMVRKREEDEKNFLELHIN